MPNTNLFDKRILRTLAFSDNGQEFRETIAEPHVISTNKNAFSYVMDMYETPGDIDISMSYMTEAAKEEGFKKTPAWEKKMEYLKARKKEIQEYIQKNNDKMLAPRSMVHPYAIVKLAGAVGDMTIDNSPTIDKTGKRKWYEFDPQVQGSAATPTTDKIINWGTLDSRGRFPYSFQDFVFCKYWNKIENNRMITLRRYPSPVNDAVEPANWDKSGGENSDMVRAKEPFAPLCTAITYFGEETGNSLKDMLSFSIGYEWEEIEADIWKVTATQNEQGDNIVNSPFLTTGLNMISYTLGFLGQAASKTPDPNTGKARKEAYTFDPKHALASAPPDPYEQGPYENRIIGPINVINKTNKRKPGLKFEHDGLSIKFDYVSRPISGVNNKAVMLDLLANILLMTSAEGTFFGGAHRFRTENPAVYNWRYTDVQQQLMKGKLLGPKGAPKMLFNNATSTYKDFTFNLLSDVWSDLKSIAGDLLNMIIPGKGDNLKADAANDKNNKTGGGKTVISTLENMVAASLMQGQSAPYLSGMRALLTGDPVGDWHLTIGNPLNPIAVIGNLIVEDCKIEFSDELGPDDFPIGFTATINLKHGMPRDRVATESMFNRGAGRIYSLPAELKSSADGETKVDNYTGSHKSAKNTQLWYSLMSTNAQDFIMNMNDGIPLVNQGNGQYQANSPAQYSTYQKDKAAISALISGGNFRAAYKIKPQNMRWLL